MSKWTPEMVQTVETLARRGCGRRDIAETVTQKHGVHVTPHEAACKAWREGIQLRSINCQRRWP